LRPRRPFQSQGAVSRQCKRDGTPQAGRNPGQRFKEHTADGRSEPTSFRFEISEAEIRERAYEIYVKRGGADGLDENDWFQAEKELRDALKSRRQKA